VANYNKWNQNNRLLIDFQARRQQKSQHHIHSKMNLQNNSTKYFTSDVLEPFSSDGKCENYKNCHHCLSDNSCGWCDLSSMCLSRDVNETKVCRNENNHWRYLILKSEQCINCSNYISCQSCSASNLCEWWNEDAKCERRGRSLSAIKEPSECATPCNVRKNCSNCLNDKGKCVWCQATSKCFSFSIYTSEFQFGLCREWIDQLIVTSTTTNLMSSAGSSTMIGSSDLSGHHQCRSCSNYLNCTTCLRNLNCGWCYLEKNPIKGKMIK
jgi:hypothetical protein